MRTRTMGFDAAGLDDFLRNAPPAGRLLVAFSGGLDSHVLLHALASRKAPVALLPVHVHHGLQAAADDWAEHCQSVTETLGLCCQVIEVTVDAKDEGLEAAARRARYAALAGFMKTGDLLLTAHHLDDQAETVLLQLMRGAGPAGLAAMPPLAPFAGGWLGRPLLGASRDDLQAYAQTHGLRWIDDPSNTDCRFDRNYLRHEVLPRLTVRWPGAVRNLAHAARIQADSLEQLDTLARQDIEACRGSAPESLSVSAVNRLRRGRRRNLLRLWLADKGCDSPPRGRMEAILDTLLPAGPGRTPCVEWADTQVRRYRDDLFVLPRHQPAPVLPPVWDPAHSLRLPALDIELNRAWLRAAGVPDAALHEPFRLNYRQGGERIRLAGRGHSSELKSLLQDAGIAPWERERLVLLFRGQTLLAVWGRWTAAPEEFLAATGDA